MENTASTNFSNQTGIDESLNEIIALQQKLINSSAPEQLKEDTLHSIERLKRMVKLGGYSSEFENVNKYIDWRYEYSWPATFTGKVFTLL